MSFEKLNSGDVVISVDSIAGTVWSGNEPTLTTAFTSSTQEADTTGDFYLNVYQADPSAASAAVQYAIAYADNQGSGSVRYNPAVVGKSPTNSVYKQMRNLILGDENSSFVFGDYSASYFHVISVNRARYKESLQPGSLTLQLASGSRTIFLTDNSQVVSSDTYVEGGRKYELVSGSAGSVYTGTNASGWSPGSGSYGWVLPDLGLILINSEALTEGTGDGGILFDVNRTANTDGSNTQTLFTAVSESGNFKLNSEETVSSQFIYVTAHNERFNYSENPSFISGSTGAVINTQFINNPQTFITGVGLYNDNNELLAVAKLSKPLIKDFTKRYNLTVKLNY